MAIAAIVTLLACACAGPAAPRPVPVAHAEPVFDAPARARAIVDAPDRTPEDRQLDPGRRPEALIEFLGLGPGMRVAELVAGAGYTAELLSRAVEPGGIVYAENPKAVLVGSGTAWAERLKRKPTKNVVRIDRELDDPLPPEANNLDLVIINLVYHDTVWLGVDRERMNRAVLAALRTGGRYAVIDHSARAGSGLADVRTFHRIDESTVKREIEGAGFRLESEESYWRNPSDTRDWNDSPQFAAGRRGTSDRFALLFVKP